MSSPLIEGPPPPGFWVQGSTWQVATLDQAARVRGEARSMVAAREPVLHPDEPVHASVSARVETVLGELVLNALQHGGEAPVTVELSRGHDGWLVVVSDAAPTPPVTPSPEDFDYTSPGGMGLRMATALATSAGWHPTAGGKQVWASVGDLAPAAMLRTLRRA